MKSCKQCSAQFEVSREDLDFYDKLSPVFDGKKISIPPPTMCPDCRNQRRLAFRNEKNLYQRKCDLCDKTIVSIYSADKPFKVYCSDCWWGDKWDPKDYGREFDFDKPFADQFLELMSKVPFLYNVVFNSVNCDYNSFCVDSKDCYLCTRVGDSENVMYSYLSVSGVGCIDCYNFYKCQYCYECADCWSCYNCKFCQLCKNTTDSSFCYDCNGCTNCFGCVGLRNSEYYFFNKKCTKEEYEELVGKYDLGDFSVVQDLKEKFEDEKLKHPVRGTIINNAENSSGDYIIDSKDVQFCFDVENTDTAKYSWGVEYSKNVYDGDFIYYGENCLENISNSNSSNIFFSFAMLSNVHDMWYSMLCFNNTHDCFGSLNLRQSKNCVLNKQYTPEEYEELVPKVIKHMISTGEWGEFLDPKLSPFAYNETVAQDYYPLTKEEALAKGYKWKDKDVKEYQPQTVRVPDDIKDVPDSVLKEILACEECGTNYKIVAQELASYRKMGLPIPHKCPGCRHKSRRNQRNPRKLWVRECSKCGVDIKTTYAPDRPEKVYCEKCYLEGVY